MGQVNQNRQPYALLEGDLINRPAFFEEVVPSVHMSPTMNADRHSAAVQSSATIRATIAGGFENFDRDRRVVRINGSCGIPRGKSSRWGQVRYSGLLVTNYAGHIRQTTDASSAAAAPGRGTQAYITVDLNLRMNVIPDISRPSQP